MRARWSSGSCFTVVCVLLAGMSVARPLMAQPFTLNDKIKPTELKLTPYRAGDSKTHGRVYGAVVTQTQETQYFFVQGISIYSPNYVAVTADNPSAPIQVSLHKAIWDRPTLKGQTDSAGHWDAKFKTTGDFGISVAADKLPATYAILVWVGNEIELPLVSPFKKSVGSPSSGRSLGTMAIYLVVGLLILAIAAVLLRKSGIVRMCLLIGSLVITPIFVRATLAQEGGYPKAVGEMLEQLKSFLERQESVQDFWESLKALSSDEATPDVSQRGPTLPSSCLDATWKISPEDRGLGAKRYQDCQCMTTAVDKLRANRQMLERMRILVANQKVFVDKATALGNSYAQLHTLLGLQWIGIRKHDIEEPYAQFKVISNQKHQQLMAAIEKDLKDIGECEAKFGEPDWYQKFGFIYYEFLYSAYKPSF
jgi:hypothetical protein